MLRNLIVESEEKEVSSNIASRNEENFLKLGLTDVVLLEAISPEAPLLTVDRELWGIANKKKGKGSAINFTHLLFSEVSGLISSFHKRVRFLFLSEQTIFPAILNPQIDGKLRICTYFIVTRPISTGRKMIS